jgi:hypothetical protein
MADYNNFPMDDRVMAIRLIATEIKNMKAKK